MTTITALLESAEGETKVSGPGASADSRGAVVSYRRMYVHLV